ncbi:hypothetical protein [Pseudomonas sp. PB3P13]
MNAVIHFHFLPKGDFSSVLVHDPQRSDSMFAAARDRRGGHRQSRQLTH